MSGAHAHKAGVHAFVALNLAGGIGLILVLITAVLSSNVKRTPTWYSFCVSWIFYAISYLLLFLAGEQTNPTPPDLLCSTQAALIYALPPTTCCTTLALLLHVLLEIPDMRGDLRNIGISLMLLLGPYTIFVVIFVGQMMYQSDNGLDAVQKVNRGTYCESTNTSWSLVSYAVVDIVTLAIILVQSRIFIRLYYHYPKLNLRALFYQNSVPIATAIRAMMFTLIGVINLVMAALIIACTKHMRSLAVDLIIGIFPLLTFLVFGTQKDLIQSWVSWRTSRPDKDTPGNSSPA